MGRAALCAGGVAHAGKASDDFGADEPKRRRVTTSAGFRGREWGHELVLDRFRRPRCGPHWPSAPITRPSVGPSLAPPGRAPGPPSFAPAARACSLARRIIGDDGGPGPFVADVPVREPARRPRGSLAHSDSACFRWRARHAKRLARNPEGSDHFRCRCSNTPKIACQWRSLSP